MRKKSSSRNLAELVEPAPTCAGVGPWASAKCRVSFVQREICEPPTCGVHTQRLPPTLWEEDTVAWPVHSEDFPTLSHEWSSDYLGRQLSSSCWEDIGEDDDIVDDDAAWRCRDDDEELAVFQTSTSAHHHAPHYQPSRSEIAWGLRASEVVVAQRVYGANQLPSNLPDVPLATCRAIAYVFALRPAALIAGTLASSHLAWGIVPLVLESAAHRPPRALLMAAATLGLSASVVGTIRFLEHYLSAFDRLREHVRLAQYALHRVRKGEEEEEFALVRREGVKAWVPCSALVPGDVIHLEEGRVPADCKLIEADNLKISCPIAEVPFQSNVPRVFSTAWWSCGKSAAAQVERCRLPNAHALGTHEDLEQIALSTSIVTSGKAIAIVTRTGKCSVAYLLLSRLSSLSLLEVVALYFMGGGPHQGAEESVN